MHFASLSSLCISFCRTIESPTSRQISPSSFSLPSARLTSCPRVLFICWLLYNHVPEVKARTLKQLSCLQTHIPQPKLSQIKCKLDQFEALLIFCCTPFAFLTYLLFYEACYPLAPQGLLNSGPSLTQGYLYFLNNTDPMPSVGDSILQLLPKFLNWG